MTTRKNVCWIKVVLFCVTVLLLATVVFVGMLSAQAETSSYYTYTVTDGKATITEVDKTISGEVTIPATLDGYPVVSIGESAFQDCTGITGIAIPDSVTGLNNFTFYNCTGLMSVTIPSSVKNIGQYVFAGCTGLADITISEGVESIGVGAFHNCTALESITVPDSVISIGRSAFGGCSGLTKITLPFVGDTLNEPGYTHFGHIFGGGSYGDHGWTVPLSLKEVVITKAERIGDHAFRDCTHLTSITLPDSLQSIGKFAFYQCKGLTSFVVPSGLKSSDDEAFSYCDGLTDVHITDMAAWYNISFSHTSASPMVSAENLYLNGVLVTELELPDGMTSIGDCIFSGWNGLTSITIPNSVTTIGKWAFTGCTGLTSITIPESVTTIVGGAFSGCTGLTSITIPDSVTSIGSVAFQYCTGLKSVILSKNLKSIESWMFYNCTALESITIPDSVTSIGSYAFQYCEALTDITFSQNLTSIGQYAFSHCIGLTNVTLPETLTDIGSGIFGYCTGIESITIPGRITKISDNAFEYCTKLKSITIPGSVTTIGGFAFIGCTELTNVYFQGTCVQRNQMASGAVNSYLFDAEWHYASVLPSDHVYTDDDDTDCNICGAIRVDGTEKLLEDLNAAQSGDTVTLTGNAKVYSLVVPAGVTLDLNGYTLEAEYLAFFGNVENGTLKVPKNQVVFVDNNTQLPVWNGEAYVLVQAPTFQQMFSVKNNVLTYTFLPAFDESVHALLAAGAETSNVSVTVRVSWTPAKGGSVSQDFVFSDSFVKDVINSYADGRYGLAYTISFANVNKLSNLQYSVVIVSGTGVSFTPSTAASQA